MKYNSYKNSGVAWLGEVPEHWEVIKNKFIFEFSKGLTITKENLLDDGIPCVNYGEIHSKYGFEVNPQKHALKCVSEEYLITAKNAVLKQGDFIFADTSEDIKGSGNFTHLSDNTPIFAGYHTIIARPNLTKIFPKFLAYVFESDNHRNQVRAVVKGVKVFSVTQAFLKNTFAWFPTLEEQTAIANYLDNKLKEIDTLISKQQTLLDKLAEQRTATITHAVTRGLNPNVPMKHSGVAWLGDVPEHWEVKRLKFIQSENLKYGSNDASDTDSINEPRYIRITDIKPNGELKGDIYQALSYEKSKDYLLQDDDILLARSGSIGRSFLYNKKRDGIACHAGYLIRLRLNKLIVNSYFVYYFLQSSSYWNWINSINIQSTIQNISAEKYANLALAVPHLEEQTAIANYLDKQTAQIDRLSDTVNQTIARLQEYRTALITQVVTGKIKVIK